uniref:Complement component C6-like n=1 Tax=Ciona intestinalis TaxID=7719 RepID=H2XN55_CIOIN|nr:complement component C6-like isoform X1 [Ciona intestinalis]|eukprot:XP_009859862.1 complement component C6-like isoform X1 [Ciona intestinalis]
MKVLGIGCILFVAFMCVVTEARFRFRRRKNAPAAVHCAVSSWSAWSACSVSCAGGERSRSRRIIRHPAHGGNGCPGLHQKGKCSQHRCPINCEWGEWGAWSSCSPCPPGGRSRSRNITTASMFGGQACIGGEFNSDYNCLSEEDCPLFQCPDETFACADELTCIRPNLRCNGDDDCTDNSDEENCGENVRSPCGGKSYKEIPTIDIAGAGYDITIGEEIGTILDNQRYNGRCYTVRSGEHDKKFRVPANIQTFRFQVSADTSFVITSYDSSKEFLDSQQGDVTRKLEPKSSFTYGDIYSVSGGATNTKNQKTLRVVRQGASSDAKYFKIHSNIVLSQFRTLRRNFLLSYQFRQRLLELPDGYDHIKYAEVLADFGTHFYSSGTLGARYEFIYRYSKKELEESGLTHEEQKNCLKTEATFRLLKFTFGGDTNKCSTNVMSRRYNGSFTLAAKEVISNVVGGYSDKAASLAFFANNVPNSNDYDAWVETIKHNPAVIDFSLSPISSVVSDQVKRQNLERALFDYLSKYTPSKCKGVCANGGRAVVVDGGMTCKCLCSAGHGGSSCER